MASCLVAEVGSFVLQRTDRFWVLAWASVGMGTVAALGDQWWCSALMGAAASSPSLLLLQPSLSSVRWLPTLEEAMMLVSVPSYCVVVAMVFNVLHEALCRSWQCLH